MGKRWIRLNADWEDSAWLDALPGNTAGCWPRLLCWVKLHGYKGRCDLPDLSVLARRWRVSRQVVDELVRAALKDGALETDGCEFVIANWSQYQEPDPTAPQRMRRMRERQEKAAEAEERATLRVVTP